MSSPAPPPFPSLDRLPGSDGSGYEQSEHIVHEHDPDTALCGIDQTGVPWHQGFPVCQACLAVAEGRMN